ncbi:hypothetical protein CDAR_105921 [Caerostris darwini]|uniref:Uncharacterized protein n=1 Tax=Caerostris darwini TaxID=1538125 RepID=A0AAV4TU44_9ARAC|nr:hypothetical protein CDAR_105921 [Caerostris darwini]
MFRSQNVLVEISSVFLRDIIAAIIHQSTYYPSPLLSTNPPTIHRLYRPPIHLLPIASTVHQSTYYHRLYRPPIHLLSIASTVHQSTYYPSPLLSTNPPTIHRLYCPPCHDHTTPHYTTTILPTTMHHATFIL